MLLLDMVIGLNMLLPDENPCLMTNWADWYSKIEGKKEILSFVCNRGSYL